jgi:hypothetical protein
MKRPWHYIYAVFCCILLAGCFRRVTENGDVIFSFEPWVPLLVVFGGFVVLLIGVVLLLQKQRFWGILVAIAGPLIAGVIAPGMYQDHVVVNQEGFYSRHGFWWNPTTHKILYKDLNQVQLVIEERTGRRGKTKSYFFDCTFKSGQQERVPLGDIMREALPEITEQFRVNGVPLQVPPNLPK